MNMMSKPELFCPQLPKFEVASDVETDGSVVLFELKYGCIVIQCSMTADVVNKSRKVSYIPSRYGSNYQYEGSWRHTPFRNRCVEALHPPRCSWRHTPFRKLINLLSSIFVCSWRHTPFRNLGF